MGDLAKLAVACGSDKVPNCDVYETYLSRLRDQPIAFFEIGVGGYDKPDQGGGSVRMWKRYFDRAQIYALDIYDKSAHQESRISIFQGSQDDAAFLNLIADQIGDIDVILDDGSHISTHVIKSFEVLFPRLKPGGLYIVEDVGTSYWTDHGGSTDLYDPKTSMNFFKKITDGINSFAMKHKYEPTYADQHVEFIHFYTNFIVIKKKQR